MRCGDDRVPGGAGRRGGRAQREAWARAGSRGGERARREEAGALAHMHDGVLAFWASWMERQGTRPRLVTGCAYVRCWSASIGAGGGLPRRGSCAHRVFCSAIRHGSARWELHASWARLVSLGSWDGGAPSTCRLLLSLSRPRVQMFTVLDLEGLGALGRGWSSGTRGREGAVERADAEGLGTALRKGGGGDVAGLLSKEA
ncbi:hypothetical protein DFH09DRAFT_485981 [Mycena vulgaris]|nr:hypothetical protein DFH09DRAFT_485981 [Mycena vulgaris]